MKVEAWRQRIWDDRLAAKQGRAIAVLDLPKPIHDRLRNAGIDTVEELVGWTASELKEVRNINDYQVEIIALTLRRLNLVNLASVKEKTKAPSKISGALYSRIKRLSRREVPKFFHKSLPDLSEDDLKVVPIERLRFHEEDTGLYNTLKRANINSVQDLLDLELEGLSKIKGLGDLRLSKILACLDVCCVYLH